MPFDLNRSEDQRQILDAAAAMLATAYPVSRLRTHTTEDLSSLSEFGAFALALPEAEGGAGFTLVEEALVHVSMGRHAVSTQALATSIAQRLASALGGDVASSLSTGAKACVAIPDGRSVSLIDPEGAGYVVLFGDRSLSLASIASGAGRSVEGLGHGVALQLVEHADLKILGAVNDPDLLAVADLLVSAELLGVAEAARDLTVAYVKMRHQFGRPIGSFQAIKHRCADMAIATEMLSSQLDIAAIALRDGRDDARYQVAALRLLAPQVALNNTRTSIQLHGGIGFSDEADAHHFLKQAHLLLRLGKAEDILSLPSPMSPYR